MTMQTHSEQESKESTSSSRTVGFIDRCFNLDSNATTPLASSVKKMLLEDSFIEANPSAPHRLGKQLKTKIQEVEEFLFKRFGVDSSLYKIIFHSGATEGINLFFSSCAKSPIYRNWETVASRLDHSLYAPLFKHLGFFTHWGDFDEYGRLIPDQFPSGNQKLVNWTWVNNESGVVQPLNALEELKSQGHVVHIDGAQALGRIPVQDIPPHFDALTFSGHKFGALPGIGFSFINRKFPISPLIVGGSQQQGLRAGTLNYPGILSLKLAIEEIDRSIDFDFLASARNELENLLLSKKTCHLVLPLDKASPIDLTSAGSRSIESESIEPKQIERAANTILFYDHEMTSDKWLPMFDLNGLALGLGSACSSGASQRNNFAHTYFSAKKREDFSSSVMRLSLPWDLSEKDFREIKEKLSRFWKDNESL